MHKKFQLTSLQSLDLASTTNQQKLSSYQVHQSDVVSNKYSDHTISTQENKEEGKKKKINK